MGGERGRGFCWGGIHENFILQSDRSERDTRNCSAGHGSILPSMAICLGPPVDDLPLS